MKIRNFSRIKNSQTKGNETPMILKSIKKNRIIKDKKKVILKQMNSLTEKMINHF